MMIPSTGLGFRAADDLSGDDLGWPKFLKKAAGAVASGARKVGSGVSTAAKKVGSVVVAAHLIPLKLALRAAKTATNLICSAPQPILAIAAGQAGVPLPNVNLFCQAVRIENFGQIKRLLPSAIKVMAALAASGAVPGAGPALTVITRLVKIPGLSGADPEIMGAYLDEQLAGLYDSIPEDQLREACLGSSSLKSAAPALLLVAGAGLAGYGIYSRAKR